MDKNGTQHLHSYWLIAVLFLMDFSFEFIYTKKVVRIKRKVDQANGFQNSPFAEND